MAISFNANGVNGLMPLVPSNGGMGGWLAGDGNVCNDQVAPIARRYYQFSGPGTGYLTLIGTGLIPRTIVWEWRIKTTSAQNMNRVEAVIQDYIADGRPYALVDSDGRVASLAILLDESGGTSIVRHRRNTSDRNSQIADWRLVFRCCLASWGDSVL